MKNGLTATQTNYMEQKVKSYLYFFLNNQIHSINDYKGLKQGYVQEIHHVN